MPYLNMIPFASGNTLETMTKDATATEDKLLINETAYVNGEKVTGTMPDQGSKTASLNCGESYNIPEGYHDGSGNITANSLASQTSGTATANNIIKNYTAWVNGSKLTGTADQGYKVVSGTVSLYSTYYSIKITPSGLSSIAGVIIELASNVNTNSDYQYRYTCANTMTKNGIYGYTNGSRIYYNTDDMTCDITTSSVTIRGSYQGFIGDYFYIAWGN